MVSSPNIPMRTLLKWFTGLLIVKVTVSVVLLYPGYIPPDFETDFLLGRRDYFWGSYAWAFYAHLVSGPPTLLVGLVLLSDTFRRRWPNWHRRLGRFQVANVLCLLVPSGLWMACHAMTGPIAGAGFVSLSLATGVAAMIGWRCAVRKRFRSHRRWMLRLYVLLCSAVVIRIIGGLATVLESDALWVYQVTAWASWLGPLVVLELVLARRLSVRRAVPEVVVRNHP